MAATAINRTSQASSLVRNDVEEMDEEKDGNRLQCELNQLIEEEFKDCDLDDEPIESCVEFQGCASGSTTGRTGETTSINAAGNIQALADAICNFGEDMSRSEDLECDPFYLDSARMYSREGFCCSEYSPKRVVLPSLEVDGNSNISHKYSYAPANGYLGESDHKDCSISDSQAGEFDYLPIYSNAQYFPSEIFPRELESTQGRSVPTASTLPYQTQQSSMDFFYYESGSKANNGSIPLHSPAFESSIPYAISIPSQGIVERNCENSEFPQFLTGVRPESTYSFCEINNDNARGENNSAIHSSSQGSGPVVNRFFGAMPVRIPSPEPDDDADSVSLSPPHDTTGDIPCGLVSSARSLSTSEASRPLLNGLYMEGSHDLTPSRPVDDETRRQIIFDARGRQLEEAKREIEVLKVEIDEAKGLSRHKEILAKAEIESLSRELARVEVEKNEAKNKVSEVSGAKAKIEEDLCECNKRLDELNAKIVDVEATNASLSAELVQLTTGATLTLAKQREADLAEGLARRFAIKEDSVRENLEAAKRRLSDKDVEIAHLRKDLEQERAELQEVKKRHAEVIVDLQRSLQAAQDRCGELASSSLCTEIVDLRTRINEAQVAKQIADDVNEILQDELRDVREQVSLYELALGISKMVGGTEVNSCDSARSNEQLSWGMMTPGRMPIAESTGDLATIIRRQRCRRRSCQLVTFAPSPDFDDQPPRPASAGAPLCSTENAAQSKQYSDNEDKCTFVPPVVVTAAVCGSETLTSTTPSRRSALGDAVGTSYFTEGITTDPVLVSSDSAYVPDMKNMSLGSDGRHFAFKKTLSLYHAKRQQITKLHETLFSTRCDLRKTVAARDRAESARSELQVRVCKLEKEVNSQENARILSARESALVGQLERVRLDYSRLETELQNARTRLQDALAAEARALAAERASRERLEASAAEREAAVERVRATCEAHYTAARRRLEAEWNNEHDRIISRAKQDVAAARDEMAAYQAQAERLMRLYQEAREATAKAVELTLHEAMREREAERIRFWREELPRQLEEARNAWISCPSTRESLISSETERIHEECRSELVKELSFSRKNYEKVIDELKNNLRTLEVKSVRSPSLVTKEAQTEVTDDYLAINSQKKQMEVTPLSKLPLLNDCLKPEIFDLLLRAAAGSSNQVASCWLLDAEAHLTKVLSRAAEAVCDFTWIQVIRDLNLTTNSSEVSSLLVDLSMSPGIRHFLDALDFSRPTIIPALRDVIASRKCNSDFEASNLLSSESFEKIKEELLTYVESCQSRSAKLLHSHLSLTHRRACRQFAKVLKEALVEAGAPGDILHCSGQLASPALSSPRLKISVPTFEALLHVIDAACLSAEVSISKSSRSGRPVFSPQIYSPVAPERFSPTGRCANSQAAVSNSRLEFSDRPPSSSQPEDGSNISSKSRIVRFTNDSGGKVPPPIPAPRRRNPPAGTSLGPPKVHLQLRRLFDSYESNLSPESTSDKP